MTDGEALLAAILANPKDDTPRLVYADWLEENGQAERAEFIRVQCEVARIGPVEERGTLMGVPLQVYPERYFELRDRERELQTADNIARWAMALLVLDGGNTTVEHRRGFVAKVSMDWHVWRTKAAAILAAHPIERVRLTTYPFQAVHVIPGWTRDEQELEILGERWAGIEFELPPERALVAGDIGQLVRETLRDLGRQRFRDISAQGQ